MAAGIFLAQACPCREFFFDFALMGCSMIGGAAPENETHFSTQATEAVNSAMVRELPEADPTIPTPRKGIMSVATMISEAPTVDTFVEAGFDLRWPESITHSECRECFRRILEAAPEILERKVASKRRRDFGLIQL